MTAAGFVARAHAAWPAGWVEPAELVAHAARFVATPAELDALHAGDLYLALACARGVPAALAVLEREHLARMREFAASVDRRPAFAAELAQELRARLLVGAPGRPPRIATYSGRGSLGGWVRVAAVRLARDLAHAERRAGGVGDPAAAADADAAIDPHRVDPELGYLKRAYGEAVSAAVAGALADLAGEPRTLLKLHYVDGLSIDQIGVAFGKSRATAARMLAAARLALLAQIRARLVATVGIRVEEADSLLAFVRSRLELSLARALA